MKQKNTAPAQGGIRGRASGKYNPCERRALLALDKGPLHREEIDRATGASNGPYVVSQLRGKGWDIPCERVEHTDRDGRTGWHGVYKLSENDRIRLSESPELQGRRI